MSSKRPCDHIDESEMSNWVCQHCNSPEWCPCPCGGEALVSKDVVKCSSCALSVSSDNLNLKRLWNSIAKKLIQSSSSS